MHFTTLSIAAFAAVANAATILIGVGVGGELTYDPPNATAAVNDTLQFIFYPTNHSVIQSTFAAPCTPKAGGFFSTFMPTSGSASTQNPNVFEVVVNNTMPIWFYCGQVNPNHCNGGMVGSINANTTGNGTYADFLSAAQALSTSSVPNNTAVTGGVIASLNSTNSTNSTTGSNGTNSTTSNSTSAASPNAVATVGSLGTVVFAAVAAAVVFAI